jgi:O-antigen/teichoic acid export membrane protein
VAIPIQIHLKKIFSDSLVYGIGHILNRFLNFLLLPLYTFYFNPHDYGIFSLIYAFWFFAAVLYLFGMETSFQKFFIEYKEFPQKQKLFSSVMVLMLVTSTLLSFILYAFSGPIAGVLTGDKSNQYLIKLLSILLILDTLSRFPMILLNSLQLSKVYTIINLSTVGVNIICNIIFIVYLNYGIEAILYSYLISYSFMLLVSLFYCREYFGISKGLKVIRELKTVVSFAHIFAYYGIFVISLDLIDRFILGYFRGPSEVGIYSACYRIGLIINLLISGFRTAWYPFFLNLKDDPDNKIIFSKIFSLFCYGSMLLFLVISLFANDLIKIHAGNFSVLDQRYWSGMIILPYILLSYILFGLYTNLNVAAYFGNKVKYLIISSAAGCISNVIFNLILIPKYSFLGAAASTLLSYALMFIILYLYSQRLYHIQYDWNRIVTVIVLTISLFFLNNFIFSALFFDNLTINILKLLSISFLALVLIRYNSLKVLNTVT